MPQEAHAVGFRTVLIFIDEDHPQVSIARVMDRIDHGGHDVPDEVIEDRFPRCLDNLKKALGIAGLTLSIDNIGELRHDLFGLIERGSKIKHS